jgi:hypothetical protein
MSVEEHRRKAEELLRRAARTTDLRMRGLVLEEALFWHHLALQAYGERHRDASAPSWGEDASDKAPPPRPRSN